MGVSQHKSTTWVALLSEVAPELAEQHRADDLLFRCAEIRRYLACAEAVVIDRRASLEARAAKLWTAEEISSAKRMAMLHMRFVSPETGEISGVDLLAYLDSQVTCGVITAGGCLRAQELLGELSPGCETALTPPVIFQVSFPIRVTRCHADGR